MMRRSELPALLANLEARGRFLRTVAVAVDLRAPERPVEIIRRRPRRVDEPPAGIDERARAAGRA